MTEKIQWPVDGIHRITFYFKEAPEWYTDVFGYPHNGIDIACPIGTILRACDKGTVTFSDQVPDRDGMGIIIKHWWGQSLYWHLSKCSANSGREVQKGEIIGLTGATGFVTGPHLHFGVQVGEEADEGMRGWSDPMRYFDNGGENIGEPEPIGKTYVVLPGDNLWKIAVRFYGSGTLWRRIWNANQDKIKNPNLIRPFQVLRIP